MPPETADVALACATTPSPRRPTHVVHVIGTLDRGGAETLSLDVCRAIPNTEIRQTFVTHGGREGTLAPEFRAAGAAVTQCPLTPVATLPWRLWKTFRRLQPDIVVSHVSLFSAVVLAVAAAAGVRVRMARFWSEADGWPDTRGRLAQRSFMRWLLTRTATHFVAVSEAALRFAGPAPDTIQRRLLYNSVDPTRVGGWSRTAARRQWDLADDVRVIAYIGRASPEKNRPFLVDVYRRAAAHSPSVLLVVGPKGADDILAAHPDAQHDPAIILGGEVSDIGPVLAAADVFVLPSLWEGLPGVVLEALATGLPVVATDLPCLREASTYVKGLTLLSLSDGAERWAAAVIQSAAVGREERDEIRRSFSMSPFRVEHAVAQWRALWLEDKR